MTFKPDTPRQHVPARPRRLSSFAPDYMIGNYVPTRTEHGTPIALPDAYAGSLTRDGMSQSAMRILASVQHESDAIALSDTLITHNGIAHYVRSRGRYIVRYPAGDVSAAGTINAYQQRHEGR